MRPDRDTFWFRLAADYATRATCPRAQIGAILVKFDRLIGAGFNGAPAGEPHCPDTPEHLEIEHCLISDHAERNALRNAMIPAEGAVMYVVGSRPVCPNCDDRARQAGVIDIRHRPSMPSLDVLARDIRAWQAATFPRATPESVAEHLYREAKELRAAPLSPEEMADIFHLVVAAAETSGYDLTDVVATKFAENKARVWGEPDAMNVVEHVRGTVAGGPATRTPLRVGGRGCRVCHPKADGWQEKQP